MLKSCVSYIVKSSSFCCRYLIFRSAREMAIITKTISTVRVYVCVCVIYICYI